MAASILSKAIAVAATLLNKVTSSKDINRTIISTLRKISVLLAAQTRLVLLKLADSSTVSKVRLTASMMLATHKVTPDIMVDSSSKVATFKMHSRKTNNISSRWAKELLKGSSNILRHPPNPQILRLPTTTRMLLL